MDYVGNVLLDKEFFKLDFVEFALMEKALMKCVLSHRTFLFQSMLRQTLNKMFETREMTFIYSFGRFGFCDLRLFKSTDYFNPTQGPIH